MQWVALIPICVLSARVLPGADVSGTIVIERKLTKRTVTASAGLYQRGAAPPLGANQVGDPLDYERSHVVVYLEGGPLATSARMLTHSSSVAVTPTIEQKDRRFVPDLIVVSAGSPVAFPNFDPIFHNVFSLSKPKEFDLGNYPQGQTRSVTFSKPGTVYVYCHLHPNMAATIIVSPTEWGTIADPSGRFTLPEVPPGKYTVVAWHKAAGTFRQKVEVTSQGAQETKFIIPLTDDQQPAHATAASETPHTEHTSGGHPATARR